MHPRGEGNAAADWTRSTAPGTPASGPAVAGALDLPAEVAALGTAGPRLSITLTNRQLTNPVIVSYHASPAQVRENRELIHAVNGDTPQRSTRHLEIALAPGTSYRAGDHLGCCRATTST